MRRRTSLAFRMRLVAAAIVGVCLAAPHAQAAAGAATGDWPMWQHDIAGSRSNPDETTITPTRVGGLALKWAFAFPGADAASSQPAVVGDTLYVGGRDGYFYALDARTGRQKWRFDTASASGSPTAPATGLTAQLEAIPYFGNAKASPTIRDGAAVIDGTVYFGDSKANLYALDAATGKLRWITKLDEFLAAIVTGSPVVHDGKVFVGVSSGEEAFGPIPAYDCCHFRGSVVALDAATGKLLWRHYTIGVPQPSGDRNGLPYNAPSGAAVWASPAIDARSGTVVVGTGNPYSGQGAREANSMIGLDAETGREVFSTQLTQGDQWNLDCIFKVAGNCPHPGPDFDFAAGPNVFEIGGRTVVGEGQKSGVYHVLDVATGKVVWQTEVTHPRGPGGPNFQQGIQWGTSYDGHRIYVATAVAEPGGLSALDPSTGKVLWHTDNPADGCSTGGGAAHTATSDCALAMPAAVSTSPGLVFEGSLDGKLRAFSAATGRILWSYDTVRSFTGTNGVNGNGGSVSGAGAVVSHGMVYVNSGYNTEEAPASGITGNVLLAFGLPAQTPPSPPATGPAPGPKLARAAALRRCITMWNGSANRAQRRLTRRTEHGHRRRVYANLLSDDQRCLISVRISPGRHQRAAAFQMTLRGKQYKPVGQAHVPPPRSVRRWNLVVRPHGTVARAGRRGR